MWTLIYISVFHLYIFHTGYQLQSYLCIFYKHWTVRKQVAEYKHLEMSVVCLHNLDCSSTHLSCSSYSNVLHIH